MWKSRRIILFLTIAAVAATARSADETKKDGGVGITLRLRDAREATGDVAAAPASRRGEALDEATTSALLATMPASATPPSLAPLPFRPKSLPPPRAGRTVSASFSTNAALPASPAHPAPVPLRVLRHMPEGEAALTSHLSVTFSQPMIALAALADSRSGPVPVRLTPEPAGQWRWAGVDTLIFEPKGGLPSGADFSVEIPAGTRSAVGGVLALPLRWSFRTPHAKVVRFVPGKGILRREPVFAVVVDQAIPSAELLKATQVRVDGALVPIRVATKEEMRKAGYEIDSLSYREKEGHWLAFRCERLLPLNAGISATVRLPARPTPTTPAPPTRTWRFRTAGPLTVKGRTCIGTDPCGRASPWHVVFSNPLAEEQELSPNALRVSPEVADLRARVFGESLLLDGSFSAQADYALTFTDSLRDIDGQTLSGPRTFKMHIEDEPPSLLAQQGLVALDPSLSGTLPVYVVNRTAVEVELRAVTPADYAAFLAIGDAAADANPQPPLPGRVVQRTTLPVSAARNQWTEVRVPLAAGLSDGVGQVLVALRALPVHISSSALKARHLRAPLWQSIAWVQVTRMALDAFVDSDGVTASVTSLAEGQPLAGVEVTLPASGARATTDAQGMAHLAFGDAATPLIAAQQGNDVALLAERSDHAFSDDRSSGGDWWAGMDWEEQEAARAQGGRVRESSIENAVAQARQSTWRRQPQRDRLAWHVFDPRSLYRPGEQLKLKGWVRRVTAGPQGDVEPFGRTAERVTYTVIDQQRNEVASGERAVNRFGGFDFAFALPANVNTGWLTIRLHCDAPGVTGRTHFYWARVEEYRRPEFEITASADKGPHFFGGQALVRASAAYFAGGPLASAPVKWEVSSGLATFSPESYAGYSFGRRDFYGACDASRPARLFHEARTDAEGRHVLRVDFEGAAPSHTTLISATPVVTDVNRQTHEGNTVRLLVHPAALYVGLKPKPETLFTDTPLAIEAIVSDLDGKAVAGREVTMRAERINWTELGGEDWCRRRQPVVAEASDCHLTSSTEPATCRFALSAAGNVRITAAVTDAQGRRSETEMWTTVSVRHATATLSDDTAHEVEEVAQNDRGWQRPVRPATVTTDQREYRPGYVASVTVKAPFAPADGVLTLRRAGVLRTERFRMETQTTVLRIPVEDAWAPNVHVEVALTGADRARLVARSKSKAILRQPALAAGTTEIRILPSARALSVTVAPRASQARPGQSTTVDVDVRDAQGHPLADAEVALAVVDESVLALAQYRFVDPLSLLAIDRRANTRDYRLLEHLVLGVDGPLTQEALVAQGYDSSIDLGIEGGVAGGVEGGVAGGVVAGMGGETVRKRSNYDPLALFAPSAVTDHEGRASVTFVLPDSLTRYRILAIATDGGRRFGKSESAITADLPLMVRPSLPRFLNRADRFELPVVIQNHTRAATSVDVAVRASGIELTGATGQRVLVPADDRVELRFPARATRIGQARVEVAAKSSSASDAAEVSLPVYLPVTTEALAASGQIDDDSLVTLPVTPPADALPDYGGLSITTTSTAFAELESAVLYLATYPHECAEQVASRLLAVAVLKDMLAASASSGDAGVKDLPGRASRDIDKLVALQNKDGGFALWERGRPSLPLISLHAAHALARARANGLAVPAAALEGAAAYLRSLDKHLPKDYDADTRLTLVGYALHVRHLLGDDDAARARSLFPKAGLTQMPLETLGWILPILARDSASASEATAIRREIANRVTETSDSAHFATSYREDDYVVLRSAPRTDAVLLEALIEDQPQSTLIPKLMHGLLAQRRASRWLNTQDNCFALLALSRYFRAFEKTEPEMVARVWLGGRGTSEMPFSGHGGTRQQVDVPLAQIAPAGAPTELLLAKDGRGRLYYRVGLDYAPSEPHVAALDRGFAVERRYEGADRAEDVTLDADGTWHIRAGARVRVRLKLTAPARRYQVALVDPLPAGLEPERSVWSVPSACWAEHESRRDDRMEAFASLLWGGAYEYIYVARATTPGEFIAPPTRAEEMYAPDTFGRTATDRVVVAAADRDAR